jgi:lipoate-protein ligase A
MARPPWAGAALDGRVSLVLGRAWHTCPVRPGVPVRLVASGGSAVLRGPWLLRAAVRLPPHHALLHGGPVAAARWLGGVHLRWLAGQGITHAQLYEGPAIEHWSCFAGRGPGEVLVEGRKLVGIAQAWRRHAVWLASATLLTPPPWRLLCELMHHPAAEAQALDARAVDLRQCLGGAPEARDCVAGLRATLWEALA